MPLYEYKCQSCEHQFEEMQKMTDAPLTKCPKCAKDQLQKVISSTSFSLKGSGWYVTDYKKSNSSSSTSGGSSS